MYQEHYHDTKISKLDIFWYVYGILHHQEYRKKYANNLSRELPHIPMAPDFWTFSKTGKKLACLHLSWETCKRHDLGKPKCSAKKFEKLSFGTVRKGGKSIKDKSILRVDGNILFDNLPEMKYMVNGRTPIEWAVDRYKVSTDKASGITNDATNVDLIPLIERLVYVGLESDRLVALLPDEFEPKDWNPQKTGLDNFIPSTKSQTRID